MAHASGLPLDTHVVLVTAESAPHRAGHHVFAWAMGPGLSSTHRLHAVQWVSTIPCLSCIMCGAPCPQTLAACSNFVTAPLRLLFARHPVDTTIAHRRHHGRQVDDLLAKSKANKALNDKKRLATSSANLARTRTVYDGTCALPYNFFGCEELALNGGVKYIKEDIKLECEGKAAGACASKPNMKFK